MQKEVVVWCGILAGEVPWDKLSAITREELRTVGIRTDEGQLIGYGTLFTRWSLIRSSDQQITVPEFLACLHPNDEDRFRKQSAHIVHWMSTRGIENSTIHLAQVENQAHALTGVSS